MASPGHGALTTGLRVIRMRSGTRWRWTLAPDGVWGRIVSLLFLQAEDGIRDIGVTGVQTCALPICCVYCLRRYELRSQCPNCGAHSTIARMNDTANLTCRNCGGSMLCAI